MSKKKPAGQTSRAQSRSSLVWAAEIQTLQRARRRGVAGKPTTTVAILRSRHFLEKAAILPGEKIITGCIGAANYMALMRA